jgi:hypothetical protein
LNQRPHKIEIWQSAIGNGFCEWQPLTKNRFS